MSNIVGPDQYADPTARRLNIDKMAETGVQGRGVLIDLHAHYGNARKYVDYDALQRIIEKDCVEIEEGDMLCLHTGFAQKLIDMRGSPDPQVLHHSCAVMDGRDDKLLQWIDNSGISVLVADNFAVEGFPYENDTGDRCEALPLHQACLFRLGIHLELR